MNYDYFLQIYSFYVYVYIYTHTYICACDMPNLELGGSTTMLAGVKTRGWSKAQHVFLYKFEDKGGICLFVLELYWYS